MPLALPEGLDSANPSLIIDKVPCVKMKPSVPQLIPQESCSFGWQP